MRVRTLRAGAAQLFADFFKLEAASGILLIVAALIALVCANTSLHDLYQGFRELPVQLRIGAFGIDKPLLLWINDGLMALFFLLVALEIKRETLGGQLSSTDQLMLPLVCAAAGVAVPAIIYWWLNRGDSIALRGWAVPTATDIAFALGILALLGSRVPLGMKLLLSTIAVVDDLIAIVIIAVFYTHGMSFVALGWAAAAIAAMAILNRRGVTALTPYLLFGVVLWVCVLKSGVHATLAGVVTGLLIPHVSRRNELDDATEHSPVETLEHALHPWVAYGILPLFAFVNAGLVLGGLGMDDLLSPLPLGIALGLVLGKPVGIVSAAVLMRAAGFVRFPQGMDFKGLLGMGMLCGIGFTMSLFIGSLAFSREPLLYTESVIGVLVASTVSAVMGYMWLRVVLKPRPDGD
ncbi:Na+/H+ antiporter NhaA [Luteimonas soli]|uniref:Na(+)/H(+) antiporter NhaA n=1 Tax=Luteimonas soli TaxID=1648966 RepID=A0ABV7XF34_9GAMM